ncbi:peptidylprolyl isomerase [Streptobacillus moniliformis]|uniref:Peptidyl-prolyl cis-trans isomerase n=1 Tax=Streptobacillus moniliformis (strain ATCC 14647 / DSM 12112 / NCTC 10651 / 9901) TaxID=519441 RepID=D1AY51_STRM9|nr:peptidylprolyl isomerase [Streptobacillus moniliformis]ACZ01227.1 peptidyl-prolyl cis-trans isomerase cyclophilin type [Streptobacillus moniliformis DSM 12112]AVL42414.1 peptidylprolyl isomerase [Streptobacillus moniliformis]QXW65973.1 peptidylprolyl isomerase [Streptobacillus moniliformis]SQA13618.1 Probable peptidyl-prolyl cis-trans isomerase [Streptobacillus moniliformis]
MKKIVKLLFVACFSLFVVSCSSAGEKFLTSFLGEKLFNLTEEEKFANKMRTYKLEAIIKTTKGNINVYLYPEAAPKLVANFVFLATNDYYDNLKFHRVSVNNIIQSGDRAGNGTGNPGYLLDDEFSFLRFDRAGMLAMANAGKNTNGSQIFITLQKAEDYNDEYSIIGNLRDRNDLSIARLIRQDDSILDIEILGYDVNDFLKNFEEEIKEWTQKLKDTGYEIKE